MTPSLVTRAIAQSAITKPTVLIVDDEAAPRAALTQILKQDFNILTAENGGRALAVINDHGVDLITLDLKLPDTSGSDILKEIKRTHREIEVIMVTAYGTLQSAMDCVRHGAAGFLLKPFNASETAVNQPSNLSEEATARHASPGHGGGGGVMATRSRRHERLAGTDGAVRESGQERSAGSLESRNRLRR